MDYNHGTSAYNAALAAEHDAYKDFVFARDKHLEGMQSRAENSGITLDEVGALATKRDAHHLAYEEAKAKTQSILNKDYGGTL